MNNLSRDSEKNNFLWELSTFARQTDAKMDHLIYSNRKLLAILYNLMDRKLHPKLLRRDTIQNIAGDIRQLEDNLDLPIPSHHVRAEEIARIASIDAIYHSGRVLA